MSSQNLPKIIAGGAVAAVLAGGAWLLGDSGAQSVASTTGTAAGPPGMVAGGRTSTNGQMPPGMGTPVTGATAQKVAKAALAQYPGRLEQVVRLADGSYVAHVITSNGEVHVAVSKSFAVTGVERGGPPTAGGAAPSQGGSSSAPGTVPPSQDTSTGTVS